MLTYSISSAQSETSRGMTKSLLPEFDPDRFSEMHKMFLKYGEAYFSMWSLHHVE